MDFRFRRIQQVLGDLILSAMGGASLLLLTGLFVFSLPTYPIAVFSIMLILWATFAVITIRKRSIGHRETARYWMLAWVCSNLLLAYPSAAAYLHYHSLGSYEGAFLSIASFALISTVATWYFWLYTDKGIENYEIQIVNDISSLLRIGDLGKILVRFFMLYIFIALIYAFSYDALQRVGSGKAFNRPDLSLIDFIYFSFVTITTVGYGDIYPSAWYTKLLMASEPVVGLFLVTTYLGAAISFFLKK